MTKRTQLVLESTSVLVAGLAIVGSLMFAFAQNAEAATPNAHSVGSTLEVTINDNGNAVVRGAEVTGVNGSTITARTVWGSATVPWTVHTDTNTQFVTKGGATTGLSGIKSGDFVSFSGTIDESANAFTVDANVVKDWSHADSFAVYSGTVASINEDAHTLTLTTKHDGTLTINSKDASIVGGAFADIEVGDTIVASGSLEAGSHVLSATKISLGAAAHGTPVVKDWKTWVTDMPIFKWFGAHDNGEVKNSH